VEPEPLDALLEALPEDTWRQGRPFSEDLATPQTVLFDETGSRQEKAEALLAWLGSPAQPCLFGRMAARKGWLSVCVLTEADLARGDEYVREVIQEHRRTWKHEALSGKKHGFIIHVASRRLANAEPCPALQQFALRLCELYLSRSGVNEILHDRLALRIEREERREYRAWQVGVNLFAAQGDGRWWHDHRIPGGLAFSMNSVGHMARKLAEAAARARPDLAERIARLAVEQLEAWALPLAMRTIDTASRGRIPGTWLVERSSETLGSPEQEARRQEVLKILVEYDEDRYRGQYHTDETIPAGYFAPSADRPAGLVDRDLYFTYLHRTSDPDYESMGLGQEILEALALDHEFFP
jgi:hypothetical protein